MQKGETVYLSKEETPMKWYWFNTHIRLPISLFMSLITILNMIGVVENASVIDIAYYVVHFVVLLVAEIGLLEYKKYGWISYMGALIIPVVYQSIAVVLYILNGIDTSTIMPTLASSFVFMVCEGIYFWKRRFLFMPSELVSQDIKIENVNSNITYEDAENTFIKIQTQATVQAFQANSNEQFGDEASDDFGLVPENPIYTHAAKIIEGEREYLNKLRTTNGDKITWERRGSTSVAGVNGMIDVYETFLPSGEPYKTIFINMYGARTSQSAPNGFIFSTSDNINTMEPISEPTEVNYPCQQTSTPSTQQYVQQEKNFSNANKIFALVICLVCVILLCGISFYVGNNLANETLNKEIKKRNEIGVKYSNLVDDYNYLVDDFNNVVDLYNKLLDEYNALSKQKEEYDAFENLTYSGSGNSTIKGINIPAGNYYITCKYEGGGNFDVDLYKSVTAYATNIAYEYGTCETTTGFSGPIDGGYINISASNGKWTITIEKAD